MSALRTGRFYPQELLLVLISVGGWVDPRCDRMSMKNSTDTSWNRTTATFRFVAQHLNHCATAVPIINIYIVCIIYILYIYIKVNQSRYRPGVSQRVPETSGSQISWQRHRMVVRLSALRTGRLYPQKTLLVLISVRSWVDSRTTVLSEGFYVNEKSTDTSWDRTSDLPIFSTAP